MFPDTVLSGIEGSDNLSFLRPRINAAVDRSELPTKDYRDTSTQGIG